MQIRSAWKYWIIVVGYIYLIIFFSSISASAIPKFVQRIPYFDKLFHFLLYAGLGFLLTLAMFNSRETEDEGKYIPFLAVITGIVISSFDESYQLYIPGRTSSVFDIAADLAGVLLGLIIFVIYRRVVAGKKLLD